MNESIILLSIILHCGNLVPMKINFDFKQFIVPHTGKKLAFMLPAVFMMGFTLSILIAIGFGTDPASFMNLNIAAATGFSLGNTQVIVYSIMLIFTFIFGAQMIGFGTLANMLFIGYIVDFFTWVWKNAGFYSYLDGCTLSARIIIFALTIVIFVIVASIYIDAGLGTAPYDALPTIISGAITKVPFFIIRILFDFSAIGIGLIAAKIGGKGIQGSLIGSVSMSILLGPVISLVNKPLSKILSD